MYPIKNKDNSISKLNGFPFIKFHFFQILNKIPSLHFPFSTQPIIPAISSSILLRRYDMYIHRNSYSGDATLINIYSSVCSLKSPALKYDANLIHP